MPTRSADGSVSFDALAPAYDLDAFVPLEVSACGRYVCVCMYCQHLNAHALSECQVVVCVHLLSLDAYARIVSIHMLVRSVYVGGVCTLLWPGQALGVGLTALLYLVMINVYICCKPNHSGRANLVLFNQLGVIRSLYAPRHQECAESHGLEPQFPIARRCRRAHWWCCMAATCTSRGQTVRRIAAMHTPCMSWTAMPCGSRTTGALAASHACDLGMVKEKMHD